MALVLPNLALRSGARLRFQLEQQFAGGGPFHAPVQHQVADSHILRRHHVDPQHACEVICLEFASHSAVNHVGLGGDARQDGSDQAGKRLVGDLAIGAEFLVGQRPQAGLRKQFEAQALSGNTCDFFIAAAGMAGNGDQRHGTSS
ncbi:MAG: hypothetical protein WDO73_06435 [Ignavibacteriota bacterium]